MPATPSIKSDLNTIKRFIFYIVATPDGNLSRSWIEVTGGDSFSLSALWNQKQTKKDKQQEEIKELLKSRYKTDTANESDKT